MSPLRPTRKPPRTASRAQLQASAQSLSCVAQAKEFAPTRHLFTPAPCASWRLLSFRSSITAMCALGPLLGGPDTCTPPPLKFTRCACLDPHIDVQRSSSYPSSFSNLYLANRFPRLRPPGTGLLISHRCVIVLTLRCGSGGLIEDEVLWRSGSAQSDSPRRSVAPKRGPALPRGRGRASWGGG